MSARVVLERDVPCTLRDGTVLMADVFRPDDDEKHPVLLQRTPYDKTFFPYTYMTMDPTKMALAGYVVAIQDTRGRFASQGEFVPYDFEAEDGEDAVAWAASLPWSDGTVGMYGASYMGGTQWLAALQRPPALRAIAPTTSINDVVRYHLFRGGALQLGLLGAWHMISVAPNALVRTLAGDIPSLVREVPALIDDIDALDAHLQRLPVLPFPSLDDRGGGLAPWLPRFIGGDELGLHHQLASATEHPDVLVPALQVAGWYDLLCQAELDHFTAMRNGAGTPEARALTRLIVGPWAHAAFLPVVGEIDFGFRAAGMLLDLREDLTGLHRRWFDARLKGLPTGIDDEPPVKLFVMGRNRWRYEDGWPLARAQSQRWHVHATGELSQRPPEDGEASVFVLDPDDPVPTHGGTLLMAPSYVRGPREQASIEARDDVLVFTSPPLPEELEVTGRVRFVAYVAAETVDTDVVVRLCDVHPDGRSYNVVDGIQRLRYRESLDDPKPLTPGEVARVEVDCWSTSHVFLPGHRLRVHVCASDYPRYDRCPGTGESSVVAKQVVFQRNRLFHDPQHPSHIELPVVTA